MAVVTRTYTEQSLLSQDTYRVRLTYDHNGSADGKRFEENLTVRTNQLHYALETLVVLAQGGHKFPAELYF